MATKKERVAEAAEQHEQAIHSQNKERAVYLEGLIAGLGDEAWASRLATDQQQRIAEGGFDTASPRQLLNALRNRIGRIEAVRGQKIPPMRVLSQELREYEKELQNHPAFDETRA